MLQTLRVVQPEQRRLSDCAEPPLRKRMRRIPFNLYRSPIAALDQHSAMRIAPAACCRVPVRESWRNLFRLNKKRNRLLDLRLIASCNGDARKRKAGEFQKRATVESCGRFVVFMARLFFVMIVIHLRLIVVDADLMLLNPVNLFAFHPFSLWEKGSGDEGSLNDDT